MKFELTRPLKKDHITVDMCKIFGAHFLFQPPKVATQSNETARHQEPVPGNKRGSTSKRTSIMDWKPDRRSSVDKRLGGALKSSFFLPPLPVNRERRNCIVTHAVTIHANIF